MLEKIDFSPGNVTYFDFDIDPTLPEYKDNYVLEKDLVQVEYPNKLLLDIGWNTDAFIVCVVKDYDWVNRIFRKECKTLEQLEKTLKECIDKVRDLIEKENHSKK